MVVFLTSSPCDDNVPEGVNLPCILFEKNEFVANMRKWWIPDSKGLIISAYPDNYDLNDEMRDTFEGAFTYHGMTFSSLILIDHRNEEQLDFLMEDIDFIMLAGGHVPTQNAYFKQLKLREMMKDFHGIVMGISAGSMNAADVVYVQPELPGESTDPEFVRFTEGLGLCKTQILPHYQMVKDNYLDGRRLYEDITFEDSMGHEFIVLVDASYVMVYDGVEEVYGLAYSIKNGRMKEICTDGESHLLM